MEKTIKQDWIEGLRSGSYAQGRDYLRKAYPGQRVDYCCLGVLCKVAQIAFNYEQLGRAGVSPGIQTTLMNMNDKEGKTFPEIADWIEEHVPAA